MTFCIAPEASGRHEHIHLNNKSCQNDMAWERGFNEFLKYKEEFGHVMVPTELILADGYRLGEWIRRQRKRFASKKLEAGRQSRLLSAGFEFDGQQAQWMLFYQELKTFSIAFGHFEVPDQFPGPKGMNLAMWVNKQRIAYREGRQDEGRIDLLNEIGFNFEPLEFSWQKHYCALIEFAESNGNVNVPSKFETPNGLRLGKWLVKQRMSAREGVLSMERKEKLESLGVRFGLFGAPVENSNRHANWMLFLADLKRFRARFGSLDVPVGYVGENGKDLHFWCKRQANLASQGKLVHVRRRALLAIGFKFSHRDHVWERNFGSLRKYLETYGDLSVPYDFVDEDDILLGQWLARQRRQVRMGKISAYKVSQLRSIGVKLV